MARASPGNANHHATIIGERYEVVFADTLQNQKSRPSVAPVGDKVRTTGSNRIGLAPCESRSWGPGTLGAGIFRVSKFEFEPNHTAPAHPQRAPLPCRAVLGHNPAAAARQHRMTLELPEREFLFRLPVHRQFFPGDSKPDLHGKWTALPMVPDGRRTDRDFATTEM